MPRPPIAAFAVLACVLAAGPATAQTADQPPPRPVETELNLINLPTTRSVARHGSYFRLTHRFARDLRRGSFGSLLEDFFSLDNGAIIGLEYRFGITGNLQAGVHRSILSKTIQFFGRYDGWTQEDGLPLSLSLMASVEGLNNMTDNHQPAVAAVLSRAVAGRLTLYATPAFVAHTRAADFLTGHDHGPGEDHDHGLGGDVADEHASHEHTALLGLGGRMRVSPSLFITGEFTPRLAGHDPGRGTWGIAVEKRTGGHMFQINFTNSFGTTFGQLARGGSDHDVYLGFNVTRVF